MAGKAIASPHEGGQDEKSTGKANLPIRYEVGYAKPPVEHRFKKGRSGNPGGRPRGAKNKAKPFDPAAKPTDSLILEEAYRPVTIREGEKVIELPAIQAAMRSLTISAMKGSRLSQRALAELVREVEERREKDHISALENALKYKQRWTEELSRRQRYGIEEPDPVPHPDDIIIDMRTGHVRTEGPLDEREKVSWDERLARRAQAQEEVNCFSQKFRRSRSAKLKAFWLAEWHFEQRIFDIINDSFPQRYKAKLENRSYKEGASREGKTLEEFARDRKRPMSKRVWSDYTDD